MTPEALGIRIMTWRQKRGWTQTDLGERIGLSKQSIHRLERGTQNIALSEILALAQAFQTTVAALFDEPVCDSGAFRGPTPQERRIHLIIDSLLELSDTDQKEVAFVLALVLAGKLEADHRDLLAVLREGVLVR